MAGLVDNRYAISRTLGRGGVAEVFLAHDGVLGRDVALKMLNRERSRDDEYVERFRREAQSAAALSHPNIVSIYDRGEAEDGSCYICMEYLPGGTLKDRISRDGRLASSVVAEVAMQISGALDAAHERGVIHRDIKPQNVLITRSGDVKVADFGIALAESETSITRANLVLGTAAYMSPEQATGGRVGPRSDLYSLGVVMYEVLTGEVPFDGDDPVAVATKHVNSPPRPPRETVSDIPGGLNDLVLRLLAKDPDDRPTSASALVGEIQRSMGETPRSEPEMAEDPWETSTVQTSVTRRTVPYRQRNRGGSRSRRPDLSSIVPWLLVVLFVVAVVLGGMLVLRILGGVSLP
ncbi:MAG: serine/threonine protein kinase [Rubrobacteraceae bacterium]|nr:serine/threonine protein kinase [Rubrobacteraceae bacterium]